MQLRELATGRLIRAYRGHSLRIKSVEFSSDGESILSASDDGSAIIWSTHWEGELQTLSVNSNNLIVWHPERPLIATVGTAHPTINDTTVRLIDTTTGEIVREFEGHTGTVRGLAFSPDGNYLISGGWDSSIFVRDIESGEVVNSIRDFTFVIQALAMNNTGQFAISYGERDAQIMLYDFETGERQGPFVGHNDQIFALDYSPDGNLLYSGTRTAELYQWDALSGELIQEFNGHSGWIWDIDLNSDGSKLVSASADHTAIVHDTATGEALITLRGHSDEITNVQFSPDDSLILTASLDGRIMLWDAETGDPVHIFAHIQNPFRMVASFSPDGLQIVVSGNDILSFYDISNLPDDYQTWVEENRYIPDFTCEQRATYHIQPLCEDES